MVSLSVLLLNILVELHIPQPDLVVIEKAKVVELFFLVLGAAGGIRLEAREHDELLCDEGSQAFGGRLRAHPF